MEHKEIIRLLNEKHSKFIQLLKGSNDDKWSYAPSGKWTTGQHVLHLIQSEQALNRGLRLPKFILRYKFGLSNRDSRNYDTIKYKYETKLSQNRGVVSPFSRRLPIPETQDKENLLNQLVKENERLTRKILKWNINDSTKYLLPHPLLGRMTINEIWIWTAIHLEHHQNTLDRLYFV